MTQHFEPTFRPVHPEHTGPVMIPAPRHPEHGVPHQGYFPPGPPIPPSAPGTAPRSRRRLGIAISGVVAATLVGATLAGSVLFGSTAEPAPAPMAAPAPVPAVSVPAAPAPSVTPPQTLAARQQMSEAVLRYGLASSKFGRAGKAALAAHDKGALRAAVVEFRTATADYEASLRAISFPADKQGIVTSQLLPATGALIGDLDELARLDANSFQAAAQRAATDLQKTLVTSQLVQSTL